MRKLFTQNRYNFVFSLLRCKWTAILFPQVYGGIPEFYNFDHCPFYNPSC